MQSVKVRTAFGTLETGFVKNHHRVPENLSILANHDAKQGNEIVISQKPNQFDRSIVIPRHDNVFYTSRYLQVSEAHGKNTGQTILASGDT